MRDICPIIDENCTMSLRPTPEQAEASDLWPSVTNARL